MNARRLGQRVGCVAAVLTLVAACPAQDGRARREALRADIARIVANYEATSKAVVGVSVRDGQTSDELIAIRADELFVPASNQKILTAAFALARLGGNFEFTTRVFARGQELVVVGDYDPTLGDPVLADYARADIYADLDAWVQGVRDHFGGRPVSGIVLATRPGDEQGRPADWPTDQAYTPYAAPACSINFANNCLAATFNVAGSRVLPRFVPFSRFMPVVNQIKLGPRQSWRILAKNDLSQITLRGTVREATDEPYATAIDNPAMLLGRVFGDRLVVGQVRFAGQFRQAAHEINLDGAPLVAQTRRPLRAAIWRMGKDSLNMAAECVLRRAGDGTWEGSRQAMTDTLTGVYGLSPAHIRVRDGSGLSAGNRAAPGAVTSVLAQVLRRDDWSVLVNALPLAGVEGRVADRLTKPPYRGRVLAKTGYISGAQCLSGYILDSENLVALAYSILINRVPGGKGPFAHHTHDAICRRLVDYVDGRR